MSQRRGIDSELEGDEGPVSDRLQLIFLLPSYEETRRSTSHCLLDAEVASDGLLPWLLKSQVFSVHAPDRWQKLNGCDNKAIAPEVIKLF